MRAAIFLLLFSTVIISGCTRALRLQPDKQGTYSHAVIRKQMSYEEDRTHAALKPYFTLVTWSDVRIQNLSDRTVIIDSEADRGFWRSTAKFIFTDFTTKERVGVVYSKRGFLYTGMSAAMVDLFQALDDEAAYWSTKTGNPTPSVSTP